MSHRTDTATMIGNRYNRLTVLGEAGVNVNRCKMVLCRCDCGTEKTIEACQVQKGRTKSCGCLQRDRSRTAIRKRNVPSIWASQLDYIDEDII